MDTQHPALVHPKVPLNNPQCLPYHQHHQHPFQRPDSPTSLEDSQSDSGADSFSIDSGDSADDETDAPRRLVGPAQGSDTCLSSSQDTTTALPGSAVRNHATNTNTLSLPKVTHPAPTLMMMATPPLSPTRHQFANEPAEEEEHQSPAPDLSSEPVCSGDNKKNSGGRARAGSAATSTSTPTSRASRPTKPTSSPTPPGTPAAAPCHAGQPTSAWAALLPGVAPIRVNPRPVARSPARPSAGGLSTEQRLHQQVPIVLAPEREARLTMEMYSLFESLLPTEESHQRRTVLISKIERIVHAEWPGQDIKVLPFGSTVNDLGTNTSDVDICILTSWAGLQGVEMLADVFRKHGMENVFCVPGAKVPIVKLWDPELQLSCDMNINTQLGIMNSRMVRTYVAIDPRVRPFAMIIKHWARKRVLNDAAHGGTISTYTWICMVINFLQMRSPPILPALHDMPHDLSPDNQVVNGNNTSFFSDLSRLEGFGQANKESLGGLLYAFFRKFAIEFDYDHHVVSVRHGCYLTKESKEWHIPGKHYRLLCVEEPFDTTRNLGNSCDMTSSNGLKQEFRRALDILNHNGTLDQACEQWLFPPYYYHSSRYHPGSSHGSSSTSSHTVTGRRYGGGYKPYHQGANSAGGDGDMEEPPKHKEPSRHNRSGHFSNSSPNRHERGQEKRSRSSSGSHSKDQASSLTVVRTNDARHDVHGGLDNGSMNAIPENAKVPNVSRERSGTTTLESGAAERSPHNRSRHAQVTSTESTGHHGHGKHGDRPTSSKNPASPSSSPRQKASGKGRNGDSPKAQGAQKNGRVNANHRDGGYGGKAPRANVELCLADIATIVNKSETPHTEPSDNMNGGEHKKKKSGKKSNVLWSTNSNRGDSRGTHPLTKQQHDWTDQTKAKPMVLPTAIDEAGPLLDITRARSLA